MAQYGLLEVYNGENAQADAGQSGATKTEIHSDAEDVCAKLAAERLSTQTVERPIIFVAHSLGGLVAAQILVHGEHKPENSAEASIAKNIRGLVFLGTPFRGSSVARPAEVVRRVLDLFKVDTQHQTLKLLGVDSERLDELTRAFPQVLNKRRFSRDIDHRIEAFFFYETLKTRWGMGSVQIVEAESAQLHGCGDAAPIRADHIGICKFETKDADGYATVTNYIYETDVQKDSCLKDLYITNPEADKKRIEGEKGGLLEDCYSWILYNDNFLQWRDDPEQHLLWVRGDPGKGKTMLLAGLITELEKASHDSVFYFFCQAAQPLLRNASYVLRGLIWSIVCKRPALKSYVRKEYDLADSSVFTNHNAWYALSGILTSILEDEISADFIVIIDALDECTEGREKLIGYISQCSVSCKAKWVISSRNWPDIESQLDATKSQVRLHLELNHASISNAVLKFVDRKVTQLNSTYNEPTRAHIRKHLLDNANDTFLWVALVCQELEKPGVKHYHSSSILRRFPAGLNELYERMISDINERDMEWCRAILAVVAVALRPLSLQELAAADETLTEWIEDNDTLSSLVTSCGSLLTIRGDKVYTVHQSVNDFLPKAPDILPSGVGQQHYSIFKCSMDIVHNRIHRNLYGLKDSCVVVHDIPVLPAAPLTIAGYACIYWVDHFCAWLLAENQHPSSSCYSKISQFLEKKYLYWLEAMSLLRCPSEAIKALQRLEDQLVSSGVSRKFNRRLNIPQENGGPDELKLLVNDAVRFALTHRAIMDAAPLQLYDSALIFTPQLSKIKAWFSQEINKSINIFSPDFQRWDACLQTIPGAVYGWGGKSTCEFSPDGRQIATINRNADRLLLIDISTGGLVKSIESSRGLLLGFTFHPSGHLLATLSVHTEYESKLSLFNMPDGKFIKSFTVGGYFTPFFLCYSLDGELLALPSKFDAVDTVDIWNPAIETKASSLCKEKGIIRYVFWILIPSHPKALLILGDEDISIWGLDTRHQVSKLMSITDLAHINAAAVSRDLTCCVIDHSDREVALYSWGSKITVRKIMRLDQIRMIKDVLWVDDRLMAFCGTFGMEIWDWQARKRVAQVRSYSIAKIYYGKSRQLASMEYESGNLKIWDLDTILSYPELTIRQSTSRVQSFITSPSGKVAVVSGNEEGEMLRIAVNGRFHHLPKTLQNSSLRSNWRTWSLAFGHNDYFSVATCHGSIHIFRFDHATGLYYCERRISTSESVHSTQFWGQELIITSDAGMHAYINFWDLKTGKYSPRVSLPWLVGRTVSTITSDGRIAYETNRSQVVIWDIMCRKETQRFGPKVQHFSTELISAISLGYSLLAICGWDRYQRFISIGTTEDGTWIRRYSISDYVPTLAFLTPELLDTGFGVLKCDMERGSSEDIPTVAAEDHWDPRYLSLSYSGSEAWLMRGSRRILWIPRQDIYPKRFSIHTDLEAGKSTVTLVHDECLFILTIEIDSI
ncbi:Vegetative incompatibility protein HET-E-1 [Fusarium proliferatum]|uniref:Vegetative incompatibility protein HET-E-1 n=1 Tax=Gibberella intermedia TaxID=948311 RepID=A0A420SQP8_GIBIN|nr:Vegetative incompatibility protein HET-E-1 [Fusarium proliferatum]